MNLGKLSPSVCIDAVLENMPVADAIELISNCGFNSFEFWAWWEKDIAQLVAVRDRFDMTIAACCTKFISLTDPGLRNEYLVGLKESIAAAKQLDCRTLISQVGDFRPGVNRNEQHQSIVDGLKQAAPLLEAAGVTLVIEPLNEKVNHPGYYLIRSDEAFEIIDEVGSPAVKVVFDIYHQQISEGNLIPNIVATIDKIGHFHAAGQPGRNELTLGEINYPYIFAAIADAGFCGHVGLEYWPTLDAAEGLKEVAAWFDKP
jgi:hydroxypyruvate isomerase